jgi:hypothetical protein
MVKHLRFMQRLCGNYFGLQSMLLLELERMMGNCETVCALGEQYIFGLCYSPLIEGTVVCNDALWLPCNRVCLMT